MITATKPQRTRFFLRLKVTRAHAAAQRQTRQLGVITDKLRIFGVEHFPLLAVRQQFKPVGAQTIYHRTVLDPRQQCLHIIRSSLLKTQPQPPVSNIGLERIISQRLGGTLETPFITDTEGVASSEKIIVLRRSQCRPRGNVHAQNPPARHRQPAQC